MKVLIVDDNEINRKLLRINLEGEGIETFEAEDGVKALEKLETERADVIISDILMPRMDGYRFCQEVRKSERHGATPFIFYTSTYTSLGDEKLALDCGGDRYIKKPAPMSVMLMAILELNNTRSPRAQQAEQPGELMVMREYNEALVRKLEERNAKLERAREEVMRANAGLERRVEERTAELRAVNQELEAFSHSIAHDLRSPLMAIDGFSQILLKECQGRVPPEAIEHLQFINRAARRMNELTSGLLRLSRANLAQIRRETVDLSLLAANIVQDLREAEPHREIAVKITAGMNVQADMALMRIVLENLLNNAWKFTSRTDGPEVEVGVAGTEQDPVYFVRDNGAGFDMAGASRLFGTFERLHSASEFPGNGIGLATVQRILGRHGGHIRAESAKGIGTTFFFDVGAPNRHSDPSLAVERSVE